MRTAMLKRMVKRLERQVVRSCPECRDWPAEIGLRIVEEIIEPGHPMPAPDSTDPALFGPCACCGRTHRARVVSIERD
jgi:hypothetical protein